VKEFIDIARLFAIPVAQMHCTELIGSLDTLSEPEELLDKKARQS
jgi:hypothetical protein